MTTNKKVVKEDDVYLYQRYGSNNKIRNGGSEMFSAGRNISSSE